MNQIEWMKTNYTNGWEILLILVIIFVIIGLISCTESGCKKDEVKFKK